MDFLIKKGLPIDANEKSFSAIENFNKNTCLNFLKIKEKPEILFSCLFHAVNSGAAELLVPYFINKKSKTNIISEKGENLIDLFLNGCFFNNANDGSIDDGVKIIEQLVEAGVDDNGQDRRKSLKCLIDNDKEMEVWNKYINNKNSRILKEKLSKKLKKISLEKKSTSLRVI